MAANDTKIVITAEDRATAVFGKMQQSLGSLTASMPALGAALSAGGFSAMIKGTIDAADNLNDLSQRIGIGIKDLGGWTLAANQSGTSIESVAKGVKGLSTYMVEHSDKLRAAGITATDANGAMVQLADLFASMPDGVEKTALAVQLFGKAGMDMIPMLNQGSRGLAEAQEKAAEYGQRMAELAPDADRFNDQIAEMALHSKALGINVTQYVIGPLNNMAEALNNLASGGAKAEKQMAWLADHGHPIAKAVMAWSGVFKSMGLGETRSQGYTGPKNAAGLPASEEELFSAATDAYEAQRGSRARAAGLLDKSKAGSAGAAAKYKRGFDPEADFWFAVEEAQRKAAKATMDANDKEMEALEKKRIAMEEMAEKRMETNRIEMEGEEAIRESLEKTSKVGKDGFVDLTNAIESWGNKAADTFAEFAVTGKASFGDLVNSMLMDIARLQAKQMLDPITKGASSWLSGALSGSFGGLFGGGGSAGGEWDFGPAAPDMSGFSFAGGGYTGGGSRSGGLDGQGGFMAMLHPQETVIDHARGGGSGAPNVAVNIINQSGQPVTGKQQGAPSFDGSNWVISVVMEAAGSNPGFRAAMGLGR
jgi:hypothetical protein